MSHTPVDKKSNPTLSQKKLDCQRECPDLDIHAYLEAVAHG